MENTKYKIIDYKSKAKVKTEFKNITGSNNEFYYKSGIYESELGIVTIFADYGWMTFELIHNGIKYRRCLERKGIEKVDVLYPIASEKSLSILAGKFQKEIIKNN